MRRIGIDEVGRGPLAGPVVAAAVALPSAIQGLADSKILAKPRREALAARIVAGAWVGLGAASAREIDRLNIEKATHLAMRRALEALLARMPGTPGEIVVDGNRLPPLPWPARAEVKADATVPEVSAASIVAKVVRDRAMARLDPRHPAYGWARNAGYPTAEHLAGLRAAGITRHHRLSFGPVRRLAGL
ncbi:MAG: ribonuclease HII [Geminicoccaceae bacterium]|nr:ribonuclease HII [Geminicoccaceae bacterium]